MGQRKRRCSIVGRLWRVLRLGETATKDSYTSSNSTTYGDSSIEDISGSATYDAATVNWGSAWRMPTKDECQELTDNCTWTWTTQANSAGEAISGYEIKGSNGNSIFLPAAGYCYDTSLSDGGTHGFYWTSTPHANNSNDAFFLYIGSVDDYVNHSYRWNGRSVRPVSE